MQFAYNMNDLCYMMSDTSLTDPLDRLAYLVKRINRGGISSDFAMYIELLNNSKWDNMIGTGGKKMSL